MKTQIMRNNKKELQKTIIMIHNIGIGLLNDIAKCNVHDYKLSEYGEILLKKYPDLKNFQKGGFN